VLKSELPLRDKFAKRSCSAPYSGHLLAKFSEVRNNLVFGHYHIAVNTLKILTFFPLEK